MRLTWRVLLPLCLLLGVTSTVSASTAQRSHRWTNQRVGLSIGYPAGWRVSRTPLTPVSDPVQRFVLYSSPPLRSAVLAPKRDQVIAQLAEVVPPLSTDIAQFPVRPKHFELPALGRMEGFDGSRWAEITFRDRGRGFYLFIGVGIDAIGAKAKLLRSLDSLVVQPR
jgi:hypothetical protein